MRESDVYKLWVEINWGNDIERQIDLFNLVGRKGWEGGINRVDQMVVNQLLLGVEYIL